MACARAISPPRKKSASPRRRYDAVKCLHVLGDFRQREIAQGDVVLDSYGYQYNLSSDSLASWLSQFEPGRVQGDEPTD